jgi:hypothetical protein
MKKKIACLLLSSLVAVLALPARSHVSADPARCVSKLAGALDDSLRIQSLRNGEMGILTFVDLNDLESAAPIGRYLQEKLLHELFLLNYRVVEIRLGKGVETVVPVGETALTRVREKLKESDYCCLKGLVVGTYIETAAGLQVSARLVELESSQVRASGETFIAKGRLLKGLLPAPARTGSGAPDLSRAQEVYERMPVLPAPAEE